MKYVWLFFVISTLIACTKIKKKYYETGVLKSEYEVYGVPVFYEKNGYFKSYYPDGRLEKYLHYKKSKKHGSFEFYYENGVIKNVGLYDNDSIVQMKIYEENGLLNSLYFSATGYVWYQYYKDKSLYQKRYLRNIFKSGKKEPYTISEDSCIVYFHSKNTDTIRAMSIHNIRNNKFQYEKSVYCIYSREGELIKKGTTRNGIELEPIQKKALGKDTLQLNDK